MSMKAREETDDFQGRLQGEHKDVMKNMFDTKQKKG